MRVSIVLTVYNGEKYLSAQLESIREQTVLPFELIAVLIMLTMFWAAARA